MAGVEIALGKPDDGRTVTVRPGDTLVVRLDEVPTSGYRWEVESPDPGILRPAGDHYEPPPEDTLGGRGTRTFRFEAIAAGNGKLQLDLRRSWEPTSVAAERFLATIEVE
jgi:inhibitor of cysteine peptidase